MSLSLTMLSEQSVASKQCQAAVKSLIKVLNRRMDFDGHTQAESGHLILQSGLE